MLRTFLIAATVAAVFTALTSSAQAQDEKLGVLGRTYLRQAVLISHCSSVVGCTSNMTATIKTATRIGSRATTLMKMGDVPCVKPSARYLHAWQALPPAAKAWVANPGAATRLRFLSVTLRIAKTLPDLYHKC